MSTALSTKKVLILGLPNSGKSRLFSRLTGRYAEVANAPLTTIDLNQAPLALGKGKGAYEIIDSPGIQDLFTSLNESETIREAIFALHPDAIIMCLDANRLKQSLALALEVQTLGIPMVVSLNLAEEARARGLTIDAKLLSHSLDVPVVTQNGHVREALLLADALGTARPGQAKGLSYGKSIGEGLRRIQSGLPEYVPYPRAVAMHMLMGGAAASAFMERTVGIEAAIDLMRQAEEVILHIRGDALSIVKKAWSRWIDQSARRLVRLRRNSSINALQTLARLTRSIIFGPLILIIILYFTFFMVVDVANTIAELLNDGLWMPIRDYLAGVLPPGFISDFLIGDYGILSMGLANALLTVLPILSVFYLVFNTLEDAGYLPNLSVLTRRILAKIGLGGSAIMPLILGFGCKTMATLTAKTLTSSREKFITIFLVAFAIPCAGQMGLNMSIIGRMGWGAFVISSVSLVAVELAAGVFLHRFLKRSDEKDLFILELPPIRIPQPKAVLQKTYMRISSFLRESLGIFVMAALALFAMDRIGLLGAIKDLLGPVLERFLGLPSSMLDAIILLLARHEAAAAVIIDLIRKGQLGYRESIIAVTLTTMFIPCFANMMAMVRVLGLRSALVIFASVNVAALASCAALNWILIVLGYS